MPNITHAFAQCHDTHGQRVRCYACKVELQLADAFADLDGPSFEAYYCRPCTLKACAT